MPRLDGRQVPGRTRGDEASQVIIHVRMLDDDQFAQQEALGIVGVNLIHGAYALAYAAGTTDCLADRQFVG